MFPVKDALTSILDVIWLVLRTLIQLALLAGVLLSEALFSTFVLFLTNGNLDDEKPDLPFASPIWAVFFFVNLASVPLVPLIVVTQVEGVTIWQAVLFGFVLLLVLLAVEVPCLFLWNRFSAVPQQQDSLVDEESVLSRDTRPESEDEAGVAPNGLESEEEGLPAYTESSTDRKEGVTGTAAEERNN